MMLGWKKVGLIYILAILISVSTAIYAASYTQYPPYPRWGGGKDCWGNYDSCLSDYTASSSGDLEIIAEVSNEIFNEGAAWATALVGTEDVLITSPFLYIWNGTNFINENDLIPNSEDEERVGDAVEFYHIIRKVTPLAGGRYKIMIKESGNSISFIDNVKLFVIDYPMSIKKVVSTPDGKIYGITKLIPPSSVLTERGEDVTDLVEKEDLKAYQGYTNSSLLVSFDLEQVDSDTLLLFLDFQGYRKGKFFVKKPVFIEFYDPTATKYVLIGKVFPHVNRSDTALELPDTNHRKIRLKITFSSAYRLNSIGIGIADNKKLEVKEATLADVFHSNDDNARGKIIHSDDEYVILKPGETLTIGFGLPPERDDMMRTFIIRTEGYYVTPSLNTGLLITDPVVYVNTVIKMNGFARAYIACGAPPCYDEARYWVRVWVSVYDATEGRGVADIILQEWSDVCSEVLTDMCERTRTWSADYSFSGSFSVTADHYYVVYIEVEGESYSTAGGHAWAVAEVDFMSDAYDLCVRYIDLSW